MDPDKAYQECLKRWKLPSSSKASTGGVDSTPTSHGGASSGRASSPIPTTKTPPPVPPHSSGGSHGGGGSSKGNSMPVSGFKVTFDHVMVVALFVAGVFTAVHDTPKNHAAIQKASIEKSLKDTEADARLRVKEEETKQKELDLKIAKVTGMAPSGFTTPSHQATQQQIAPNNAIRLELNKSFFASQNATFMIEGNVPGTFAVVMYAPHAIKSIEGEYRLVYGKDQTQKTEWVKSLGDIPETVRVFLETHKHTTENGQPIAIYTKGRVIIKT